MHIVKFDTEDKNYHLGKVLLPEANDIAWIRHHYSPEQINVYTIETEQRLFWDASANKEWEWTNYGFDNMIQGEYLRNQTEDTIYLVRENVWVDVRPDGETPPHYGVQVVLRFIKKKADGTFDDNLPMDRDTLRYEIDIDGDTGTEWHTITKAGILQGDITYTLAPGEEAFWYIGWLSTEETIGYVEQGEHERIIHALRKI